MNVATITSLTGLWTTVLKHLGWCHFGFLETRCEKLVVGLTFESEGTNADIVASCQSQASSNLKYTFNKVYKLNLMTYYK